MENPAKLVSKARQNRRRKANLSAQPAAPAQHEAKRAPVPLPDGHANYSALMRSHDRMNSRHISGHSGT